MTGCYIIYSKKLNKFYIGATQDDLYVRIEKHNNHTYGNHRYTAKSNDWELFVFIECVSYTQAIRIEKHIKKMKSSNYIKNLIEYPELVQKLKDKYND